MYAMRTQVTETGERKPLTRAVAAVACPGGRTTDSDGREHRSQPGNVNTASY